MSNQVHLLLTPAEADRVLLVLKHFGHAQYLNRTYRCSGTLWEG
jgi:putative transposase